MMKQYKRQCRPGVTIVEALIASVVLAIVVLGSVCYRYWAASNCRCGQVYSTAGRIGLTLLEAWRGAIDPNTFDPTAISSAEMNITSSSGPSVPSGMVKLNSVKITADDMNYYAALCWTQAGSWTKLRKMQVVVDFSRSGKPIEAATEATGSLNLISYRQY